MPMYISRNGQGGKAKSAVWGKFLGASVQHKKCCLHMKMNLGGRAGISGDDLARACTQGNVQSVHRSIYTERGVLSARREERMLWATGPQEFCDGIRKQKCT